MPRRATARRSAPYRRRSPARRRRTSASTLGAIGTFLAAPIPDVELLLGAMANPDEGIRFVIGILKKAGRGLRRGVSETQSVLFDKLKWTMVEAKKWLQAHGFTGTQADEGATFWRFRQTSPKKYKEVRTIVPGRSNPRYGSEPYRYKTRFIRRDQEGELMNLYHLARVPLSGTGGGRWERMIWASDQFHKAHPEISSTAAYKDLEGLLSNWFGNPSQENPTIDHGWQWAYQYTDTAKTESSAREMLDGLKLQDGYLGGRVYFRDNVWNVQALFTDEGEQEGLPDGVKRVKVPPSLWGQMENPRQSSPTGWVVMYKSRVMSNLYKTQVEAEEALRDFQSRSAVPPVRYTLRKMTEDQWYAAVEGTGRRRNPESSAASLVETFTGAPAEHITTVETEVHEHDYLATLGTLVELKVATISGLDATIRFNKDAPTLASSEDGRQLFIEGGDQEVDLSALNMSGDQWERDSMVLGVLYELTYQARKKFDKMVLSDYYHRMAEETGVQPMLLYDPRSKLLSISGGQYEVKQEGIVN